MTSADKRDKEWRKQCDTWRNRSDKATADLCACEAEFESFRADCTATHEADNAAMMTVEAERDDLRRNLVEADRLIVAAWDAIDINIDDPLSDKTLPEVISGKIIDLRSKLADTSLANAQLREALMVASSVLGWVATMNDETDIESAVTQSKEAEVMVDAALALPVDGLAEEVRKYMVHMATCDKASNLSQYTPCTCGLDSLLARIGGGK